MDRPLCLVKEQRLNVVSGLQTQHREPIKVQPEIIEGDIGKMWQWKKGKCKCQWSVDTNPRFCSLQGMLPFARYQVGDHLYLQEPYQIEGELGNGYMLGTYLDDKKAFDDMKLNEAEWDKWANRKFPYRITSGRFMYKSLARHWFEVTGVKAEQNTEGIWEWVYILKKFDK